MRRGLPGPGQCLLDDQADLARALAEYGRAIQLIRTTPTPTTIEEVLDGRSGRIRQLADRRL